MFPSSAQPHRSLAACANMMRNVCRFVIVVWACPGKFCWNRFATMHAQYVSLIDLNLAAFSPFARACFALGGLDRLACLAVFSAREQKIQRLGPKGSSRSALRFDSPRDACNAKAGPSGLQTHSAQRLCLIGDATWGSDRPGHSVVSSARELFFAFLSASPPMD